MNHLRQSPGGGSQKSVINCVLIKPIARMTILSTQCDEAMDEVTADSGQRREVVMHVAFSVSKACLFARDTEKQRLPFVLPKNLIIVEYRVEGKSSIGL